MFIRVTDLNKLRMHIEVYIAYLREDPLLLKDKMLLSVLGISLNLNLPKHIKGNTEYCHHCDIKDSYFLYLFLETVFEGFL